MSEHYSGNRGKYIIVTGGVLSSLGKGIASASIGALMESRGLSVSFMKFDPYLNVDPSFMSPYQHGEVFVTNDGAECDLDVGHYERYTTARLSRKHNIAAGRIYQTIIQNERNGIYGDKTVQLIPHVTDEIKTLMRQSSDGKDITIIELGGTVGDIESLPFIEAARQFGLEEGRKNVIFIHLTLVPFIKTSDELKTKPTQHSVSMLRGIGITPDILICRSERPFDQSVKNKISLFCNVEPKAVICSHDVSHVYKVPLTLHSEGLDDLIVDHFSIWTKKPDLTTWSEMVEKLENPQYTIKVGILDEGISFKEAYKSISESLIHAGLKHRCHVETTYINALKGLSGFESQTPELDALIIPNGHVKDSLKNQIEIIEAIRKKNIPVLALGTGFQLMALEVAQNILGLNEAASIEFTPETEEAIFHLLPRWFNPSTNREEARTKGPNWGRLMRKGAYPAILKKDSLLASIYKEEEIYERHRHYAEFNIKYTEKMAEIGFVVAAESEDGTFKEAFELKTHPFYIGCQFQPEFLSRPLAPHPLIVAFVKEALNIKGIKNNKGN